LRVLKTILKTVVVFVLIYCLLTGVFYFVMTRPPDQFAMTMRHVPWMAMLVFPFRPMWMEARKGTVAVGDLAPDFNLQSVDGATHYQLSTSRGQRPVVLLFGSYT
jgi:hypothetical protein